MPTDLTPKQRAVLFLLLAAGDDRTNRQLKDEHGVDFKAEDRRPLNERGLVETRKVGQRLHHELTDKGWAWCTDEMTADRPVRSGPLGAALYALMPLFDAYMRKSGDALADLGVQEVGGRLVDPSDVEEEVRRAYSALADRPGGWVGLADLRERLSGIDRAAVDDTLIRLSDARQAELVPESNRKALRPEDHEAALKLGGSPAHLLAIGAT